MLPYMEKTLEVFLNLGFSVIAITLDFPHRPDVIIIVVTGGKGKG